MLPVRAPTMPSVKGGRRRRVPVVVTIVILFGTASGRAEAPEVATLPIALELRDCRSVMETELRRFLAIEFATLGIQTSDARERVVVQCQGEIASIVLWRQPRVAPPREALVNMSPTPVADRPRLLALAMSEMVVEGRVASRPAPESPARVHRLPPREPPRADFWLHLLAIGTVMRAQPSGTWLGGGMLALQMAIHRHVQLALDLGILAGSTPTSFANVDWRYVAMGVHVLAAQRVGPIDLFAGPGFRAGELRLLAHATAPNTRGASVQGLWAGPLLTLRVQWPFLGRAFVCAGLEVGLTTVPVVGVVDSGESLVEARRDWQLLSLGAGVSF